MGTGGQGQKQGWLMVVLAGDTFECRREQVHCRRGFIASAGYGQVTGLPAVFVRRSRAVGRDRSCVGKLTAFSASGECQGDGDRYGVIAP
jgi:hypothetical protein